MPPDSATRSDPMMTPLPDARAVEAAIRDTALAEAMPRFGTISGADIREKRPNDPVTVADLAVEARLKEVLSRLAPGAAFVGEEGFETDAATVERLNETAAAWIVDPIDGTKNFAAGTPCFAVMVAFSAFGETRMGWIYDPVEDSMMAAVQGHGATLDGAAFKADTTRPGVGYVPQRMRNRMAGALPGAGWTGAVPELPVRPRCAGHEYRRVAAGEAAFARFGGRPKPWDHAAGTLIVAEAGGFHGLLDAEGGPYRPGRGVADGTILCARDEATWKRAKAWIEKAG